MKLMMIGAHPDDADLRAGGIAARYVERGGEAMLVSVTNGNAGHQEMAPDALAVRRKEEARRAGEVIGVDYVVLDHPDARLTPSVEVREELIGMIRAYRPDVVLAPRPFDYHPDHRAVGQLVIDASYLLTVPLVRPDVPILERVPVIAHTYDGYTKPLPFRADVVVDVDEYFEAQCRMTACHESQFFEWLPYNGGILDQVPATEPERWEWHVERMKRRLGFLADKYREAFVQRYGEEHGRRVFCGEVFELCEYGGRPDAETIERLFPR
ncbi:MAG: PIG-L family deacetylase [Candidatus Brocadiaceae bacterium]|nr:PIG-L family deacetylase [Candidatus Brocadiaceae bacterium]